MILDDDPTTAFDRLGGFLSVAAMLFFACKFPQLCAQHFGIIRNFGEQSDVLSPMSDTKHTHWPKCPFGLLNICISRHVFLCFHEGRLSQLCNKEKSVFDVLFKFHAALLTEFVLTHIGQENQTIETIFERLEAKSAKPAPFIADFSIP